MKKFEKIRMKKFEVPVGKIVRRVLGLDRSEVKRLNDWKILILEIF